MKSTSGGDRRKRNNDGLPKSAVPSPLLASDTCFATRDFRIGPHILDAWLREAADSEETE